MKIHCIQTGDVQIKSRHQLARFWARPARALDVIVDGKWSPRLPIGCWLIEHPEGLIVVDTGESSHANDPGYQPRWHPFMQYCERRWVRPEEEVGPRLRAMGFNPKDVRWVVMTHMHGDHAGGIGHFPNSTILLSKQEAHTALSRSGPLTGYLNMHYPKWLKPTEIEFTDGPFESFEKSKTLTADGKIHIVPTPGHTEGHVSVVVESDGHCILIGGDASYSETDMLKGNVDGVAFSASVHQDTTRRMRELCQRRPTITQFAHDPESAIRLSASKTTPGSY
ncbi:N-acyl homoserine lactonase family protein [Endobacterium cereale]|jgi:N-acyl homoserine lactone hydrolase|nr:N-acyl homoserine lactonase family protein [Endobacterium cereale]MEB2845738.1 N-acyl homoserine lactonase family protein [Endobacterium cereale]